MISLIAAYAHGRVIGRAGTLPWHLPSDLRHVKRVTTGGTLVMGRRTYDAIGRPLPSRRNVVLTSDPSFHPEGVTVIHDPNDVYPLGDVFIFGGEALFRRFLPEADVLYITEIDLDVPDGDTYFPEWDPAEFELVEKIPGTMDEKNPYPHTFYQYRRRGR